MNQAREIRERLNQFYMQKMRNSISQDNSIQYEEVSNVSTLKS